MSDIRQASIKAVAASVNIFLCRLKQQLHSRDGDSLIVDVAKHNGPSS